MSGLSVVTAATDLPLSMTETKEYLRLDEQVDDLLIRGLILSANEFVENITHRSLITRTLKLSIDATYRDDIPIRSGVYTAPYKSFYKSFIELPNAPVQSVTHVKYFNDSDVESTWATSNYYVDIEREPARIVLRDGGTFPTDLRKSNGLEVTYLAGYGNNPSDIPETLRLAMLQYVTFLYEHRGDFERFPPPQPPSIMQTLLQPYKIYKFGDSSFAQGAY